MQFKPGSRVVVKGLQKNPEKNGAIGVLGEFNKEKGRWLVEFSMSSNNFKEENLELMQDSDQVVDDNEEPPTSKIYITNLSAETTVKDLSELFKGVGVIAKEAERDNRGGKKGFRDQWPEAIKIYKPGRANGDGCVEYQDKFAAKAAVKTFDGYRLKGSKIGVAYAGQGRKYEARELTLPWAEREENLGRIATEA
jgi:RNA recognition motif-containing protein